MSIQERGITYEYQGKPYEGLFVWDGDSTGPLPGVLVSHAWGGRSGFEDSKAHWLASQGYAAFALDVYGAGVRGNNADENAALMNPLLADRQELQGRLKAALAVLQTQAEVNGDSCAAIGYCFGGLCVLDLARGGSDLRGVVSIHGLFNAPELSLADSVKAKVLCLHGYDDPMATPESLLSLADEMTGLGVDWQVHAYGGTLHAFTNPAANDAGAGTLYSPDADRRASQATLNFLAEVCGS
ncbi:MAG: dienelactone hydrolase family protein [Congregibacter sp.]